jgi:hypothetical protein
MGLSHTSGAVAGKYKTITGKQQQETETEKKPCSNATT